MVHILVNWRKLGKEISWVMGELLGLFLILSSSLRMTWKITSRGYIRVDSTVMKQPWQAVWRCSSAWPRTGRTWLSREGHPAGEEWGEDQWHQGLSWSIELDWRNLKRRVSSRASNRKSQHTRQRRLNLIRTGGWLQELWVKKRHWSRQPPGKQSKIKNWKYYASKN